LGIYQSKLIEVQNIKSGIQIKKFYGSQQLGDPIVGCM